MGYHRLKHSFTAGELSPLMFDRVDFERFKNGCSRLRNAICATQGPAFNRAGLKFLYDLTSLGVDISDPRVREIPFVFNELQAYAMIFYMHTDGFPRIVFATKDGLVVGTGTACIYDSEAVITYAGVGDYDVSYYEYGTVVSIDVIHTASDSTVTPLAITTDYTVAYSSGTATVSVINNTIAAEGTLTVALDVETPAISAGEVVTVTLPSTWDILSFDWAQSGDEMYIAQPGVAPRVIRRFADDCWALSTLAFIDQPKDWSDALGWPEKASFHQQRLSLSSNLLRRQTVWMSKAGSFLDFGVSSPLVDSDAVTFTLDSGSQNRIQWVQSGKSFYVGTLGNEWTVQGATQTALTPSNILAQRQTNNGSESNKPLMVGLTTLFVERHGRTVNEFVYDFNFDSYKTSDMAILSPHITEQYSITDWTYQQSPDSIIWAVRADGALLGITYQRQHKVVGWHTHDTNGEFKAVTAIPGQDREDDVLFIVKRVIGGLDKYYLEAMEAKFTAGSAEWGRFLDSHLVYQGVPADTISGFNHLIGETIGVLADGTVHPPVVVDSSGAVTLNAKYSHVVGGLPYVSEIRPLLTDVPGNDGTSLGRMQRITNVDVDLYRSLGMELGTLVDGVEKTEVIPFRTPINLTGQQVSLFTGIKHIEFPEGYDRKAVYFIRQTQPLPLTVRAVVDTIEVYE